MKTAKNLFETVVCREELKKRMLLLEHEVVNQECRLCEYQRLFAYKISLLSI